MNTVRYLKDSFNTRSYLLKFETKIVCENITQTKNSLRNDFVHYSRPDQEFVWKENVSERIVIFGSHLYPRAGEKQISNSEMILMR